MNQNVADAYNNTTLNSTDTKDSKLYSEPRKESEAKAQNRAQERNQLKDELQFHREEYRREKADFLEIRNHIRAGKLDPNSEEALNATRVYLNSSIDYMIAHLLNVRSNLESSNGNGTEQKILAIDEKISLLEAQKEEIANASSQEDFMLAVRAVRSVWNNAQKTTLKSAGQTVSEKLEQFFEKSEKLSLRIEAEIEILNESGINTANLEAKLATYNSYIKSAQEKKETADSIYNSENVTQENMEKANNYLRQSIGDINKANQILRQIFAELKAYENQVANEELNNKSVNSTNGNSSAVNVIHVKNKDKSSRTGMNSVSGDEP
jgi:chromosome segregation ATPase